MKENIFTKPERPFLLIGTNDLGENILAWLETEEELIQTAKEFKEVGLDITDSIEIGSVREIEL